MPEPDLDRTQPDHLRAGLRVSITSIAWTVLASAAAVFIGLRAGSLVLVAFGSTGILDAAGSATLAVHFRHALRHEAFSAHHERLALRVVTLGLGTIGVATAIESVRRLVTGTEPAAVPAGVAVAAASILVLAALSVRKRQVAARIPSRALLADSGLSAIGCFLATVTVFGTAATSRYGWSWVDPAASLVVAVAAAGLGVGMARAAAR